MISFEFENLIQKIEKAHKYIEDGEIEKAIIELNKLIEIIKVGKS